MIRGQLRDVVARLAGCHIRKSSAVRSLIGQYQEKSTYDRIVQADPVTAELRSALRTYAASLPPATPVPVPADQLLALLDGISNSNAPATAELRLLTAKEVGDRLAMEKQWVYRNKRALGAVGIGRSIRFSEQGIQKYVERSRSRTR